MLHPYLVREVFQTLFNLLPYSTNTAAIFGRTSFNISIVLHHSTHWLGAQREEEAKELLQHSKHRITTCSLSTRPTPPLSTTSEPAAVRDMLDR